MQRQGLTQDTEGNHRQAANHTNGGDFVGVSRTFWEGVAEKMNLNQLINLSDSHLYKL